MTKILTGLAESLGDLLQQENTLLQQSDLAGATALVARKDALLAELTAACLKQPAALRNEASSELGLRLQALAKENHDLLRQAMDTQRQVIQLITCAAAPRAKGHPGGGRRPLTIAPA